MTRIPTSRAVLRTALFLSIPLFFLLTPFGGFEPRPFSTHPPFAAMLPLGFTVPPSIVAAIGLNVAALVLLAKRPKRAAALAFWGPFAALEVLAVDQLGYFSSIPTPQTITLFEYSLAAIELVVLVAAVGIHRTSVASPLAQGAAHG